MRVCVCKRVGFRKRERKREREPVSSLRERKGCSQASYVYAGESRSVLGCRAGCVNTTCVLSVCVCVRVSGAAFKPSGEHSHMEGVGVAMDTISVLWQFFFF